MNRSAPEAPTYLTFSAPGGTEPPGRPPPKRQDIVFSPEELQALADHFAHVAKRLGAGDPQGSCGFKSLHAHEGRTWNRTFS